MSGSHLGCAYPGACVRGTFGPGCMFNCDDCQNGGKCDVRAVSCTCQPGFTGLLCNETCPKVCVFSIPL
ncbi:multiple epidermal growth factor-like domains protein 6 [Caerostris extrusa]|uniref:Multiple epidermal growth factor-like domains protein 6 n=1 Tax=Caerostris extrusa TaxID=172846 RepID=A0AAV4QJJ9_CAEEX|nr:multiple epidermal growth factor-like domains protein 6 [Caerostris extrusa]